MGMLPNVFMCVLQCVGVCFALRIALVHVSDYVFFLENLISLFYILQDVKVWKFLFRSVPFIINTSVDNYTLRDGTERNKVPADINIGIKFKGSKKNIKESDETAGASGLIQNKYKY